MALSKKSQIKPTPLRGRWYAAETSQAAARELTWAAQTLESQQWARRGLSLKCHQYMTGRPMSPLYAYAMTKRPTSVTNHFAGYEFRPPTFNVISQLADTFSTRIFSQRPFLQVTPIAGNFKARVRSKKLTRWIDGIFEDLKLWPMIELVGVDAMTTGTGIVKVAKGLDGKISVTRVLSDELLIPDDDGVTTPKQIFQRVFADRADLMVAYADDPEAVAAIKSAPNVYAGFSFDTSLNTSDIVALVEGWRPQFGKVVGRHVLAVGSHALVDEKYRKTGYPFAVFRFRPLATSWFGQGLAEQILSIQRETSRMSGALWESFRRASYLRVLVDKGSGVPDSAFADSCKIIKYNNGFAKPEFITPKAADQTWLEWYRFLLQLAKDQLRVSEQAQSGAHAPGVNAAVAIERLTESQDAAHSDLLKRLETFVVDVGELLVDLGIELKPDVRLPGSKIQQIKWKDIEGLTRNHFGIRAFPMSSLPQSAAGRAQRIETLYANGEITKATKRRLMQVPDLDRDDDLANASEDWIDSTLDRIVEDGEFTPPNPFFNKQAALEACESRYLLESLPDQDCPQDRLDLLLQWHAAVQDLIDQDAAAPGPGAAFTGQQPPPGTPSLTPPKDSPALQPQVTPAIAKPLPVAA